MVPASPRQSAAGRAAMPGRLERHVAGFLVRATLFRRRKAGAWEVPARLPHRELTFEGNTGARIAGRHFPAATGPRGIVVLAHPDRRYGQHWFVREGWIDWLRGEGYACLTFDFSQYGRSRGGSTYLFEDLAAAARLARDLEPGVPVHVVGLSIGAFSAANASPDLDFVDGLVLESPYPSFGSWYDGDGHRFGKAVMRGFDGVFPRTARLIQADKRIANARAKRILVAATVDDEVTPVALTRQVARAAPAGRTTYLEVKGRRHLEMFSEPAYREAVLRTLAG
ncbi:MAG TPA: alpha/beta fold hydrolase [Candidatus Thermoplasmatota archaeon]|nr:alpha/beta fold hydrolase [Candidatus Thermoplasmatota archaeon]